MKLGKSRIVKNLLFLCFSFALSEDALANSMVKTKSIKYNNAYHVSLDRNYFDYKSKFYNRKIPINSCNKELAEKIFKRFYLQSRGIFPAKLKREVTFKRDGATVLVRHGSRTHAFLESFPKRIFSYISLMRRPCK